MRHPKGQCRTSFSGTHRASEEKELDYEPSPRTSGVSIAQRVEGSVFCSWTVCTDIDIAPHTLARPAQHF